VNKLSILIAAAVLAAFGVIGTALVAFTHDRTWQRIQDNERDAMLKLLHDIVPADSIDNDLLHDSIQVSSPDLLGAPNTTVYRGRLNGKPVAAVFNTVAPNGYSGPIKLLVSVLRDGSLGGVRVVAHKETPGLGDKIELDKSDWVLDFTGKSLGNPDERHWGVRKDGGDFDQFSGATITPRIVVKAVKNTLLYYRQAGDALFAQPAAAQKEQS